MEEKEIGKITHYFSHVSVGVIEMTDGELKVGDKIAIRGNTTKLEQDVESLQIENEVIEVGKKGDSVGTKVKDRVRINDKVYKITE